MHRKVDFAKRTFAQDSANAVKFARCGGRLIELSKVTPNHLHKLLYVTIEHQLFFITTCILSEIGNLWNDWTLEWFLPLSKGRKLYIWVFSDVAKHWLLFLTFRENLVADHRSLRGLLVMRFVMLIVINRSSDLMSIVWFYSALVRLADNIKNLDDWDFINIDGMILCVFWPVSRCLAA